MVKLNKIYTRTGDNGTTGLAAGPRRKKHDLRVESYGAVDETNSCIGLVRQHLADHPDLDRMIVRIQNDLFDLGSDLATPGVDPAGTTASLRVTAAQCAWLEEMIDTFNEGLAPLNSFVLPGGSALAAALHVARTIVRRAERLVVELVLSEPGSNNQTIIYLNRLSDLLFVLARVANNQGKADVLWTPGRFGHDQKTVTES